MKTAAKAGRARLNDPERELDSFIEKFEPKNQLLIRSVRRAVQNLLPRANELVYDNYNFFVIGYSHTERPSDSILSLAANRNGLGIAFPYVGARLPDPHKLLQGGGTKNRFVRIDSADDLKRPEFTALLQAAVKLCKAAAPGAKPKLIIRSVSAKQRPRK
jgi:hypothetical protein